MWYIRVVYFGEHTWGLYSWVYTWGCLCGIRMWVTLYMVMMWETWRTAWLLGLWRVGGMVSWIWFSNAVIVKPYTQLHTRVSPEPTHGCVGVGE